MTVETLKKRIEGKKKAIDQLEKKIQRIEAAKATGWQKNPYYYHERDLVYANKDLETEKASLYKYEDMLKVEEEKANSRNVQALMDFLETWKAESIRWFLEEKEKYEAAKAEYLAKDRELTDKYNSRRRLNLSKEEIRTLLDEGRDLRKRFQEAWTHVTQFNHGLLSWEETLEKDLEIEKNRKYDDIIERTNKIVGEITDASNLKVGAKQDLNGYIVGTRGTAKVETIGAGGYNIQRFHFRTLIHEVK